MCLLMSPFLYKTQKTLHVFPKLKLYSDMKKITCFYKDRVLKVKLTNIFSLSV